MIFISEIVVASIALLAFGLLLVIAALRLRSRESIVVHLTIYIVLGLVLSLSELLVSTSFTPLAIGITYQQVIAAALLAMILAFGALTLNFLRKRPNRLITYWVISAIILAIWAVPAFSPFWGSWDNVVTIFGLNQGVVTNLNLNQIGPPDLFLSGLGWIVSIFTAVISLSLDFRKQQLTQYRNRLWYWLIGTALLGASGLIWFIAPPIFSSVGLAALTIGSVLVGYIVLSYQTPNLMLLIGRALQYSGVTAILSSVFFAGLAAAITISRSVPNRTNVLFWSIVVAIILAAIFPIVWRLANRVISAIVFRRQRHDERQVIKHYSQSISSALDMKRLSDVVISLLRETMGIDRALVFVNERSGSGSISLRPLSSIGVDELATGHLAFGQLAVDSPFLEYFRRGKKHLRQYDIDVLPQFRQMSDEERHWFSSLGMELYVPILRQNELEGLIAVGPQPQGTDYYDEDLDLMTALADQTALAMDSARLFEQLRVVNQEVGELTEQMAHFDDTKSDFLSIASHELRTPLTHIHGYSRMLLDLTEEEINDPSYVKTLIEGVVKGSERMKDVVDLMFDVTEANVGEMRLFTGPVNLEEVIEQASRAYIAAMDERRIAFGTDCKGLPVVEADGTRLVQAIENLLGNAVKYTPDGGTIKIEGRPVVRDEGGSAVEVVVSDTGVGIDPEEQERIFDKFYRIGDTMHHSTGKTKFMGAGPGLGLTLVKGIAEAHGGRVWVESLGFDEVNCPGSKFHLVIPIEAEEIEPEQKDELQDQANIETRHWRRSDLVKKQG